MVPSGIDVQDASDSTSRRGKSGFASVNVPAGPAWAPQRSSSRSGRAAVAVGFVRVGVAELLEDAGRRVRQERRGGEGDEPAGLDEVAEHLAQPLSRCLVTGLPGLGEHPGLLGVDDLVRAADELEDLPERLVQQAALDRVDVALQRVGPAVAERRLALAPRRRPLAAEVSVRHRDGPVDEVAEVVREVRVVAPDEAVPADTSASLSNGTSRSAT